MWTLYARGKQCASWPALQYCIFIQREGEGGCGFFGREKVDGEPEVGVCQRCRERTGDQNGLRFQGDLPILSSIQKFIAAVSPS